MDTPIGRDTASRGAEELFPVLYEELRRLAAAQLARLSAGGTLQPTVLVHEAYLKLIGRTPCSSTSAGTSSQRRRARCATS